MNNISSPSVELIREILSTVYDPEIPVLSVLELGIVRKISINDNTVSIMITPTYSGCPAMHMIESDIRETLKREGVDSVEIETIFSTPWTTEWMSDEAKKKLKKYGIAPPVKTVQSAILQIELLTVECPLCHSSRTEVKSQFGSTACKSYYYCMECRQPFEYFKSF